MKFKHIFSSFFTAIVIFAVVSFSSCNSATSNTNTEDDTGTEENIDEDNNVSEEDNNTVSEGSGEVIQMTSNEFKEKVFNYDAGDEWKYIGDLPCVIDFYADWCKPCKMVAPIMDELAEEYAGRVIFYKVDVDNEQELSSVFGIQSIPSVLFCPGDSSDPEMSTGAMQKVDYVAAIERVLGVK